MTAFLPYLPLILGHLISSPHFPKTINVFYLLMRLQTDKWVANCVEPDQTSHSAASDLGLHRLLRPACLNTNGDYDTYNYNLAHQTENGLMTYATCAYQEQPVHSCIVNRVYSFHWVIVMVHTLCQRTMVTPFRLRICICQNVFYLKGLKHVTNAQHAE